MGYPPQGHPPQGYPQPKKSSNVGLWIGVGCGGFVVLSVIGLVVALVMLGSDTATEGTWVLDHGGTLSALDEGKTDDEADKLARGFFVLMIGGVDKYELRLKTGGKAHMIVEMDDSDTMPAGDIDEEGSWQQNGDAITVEFKDHEYACDVKVKKLHCVESKAKGKSKLSKLPIVFRKKS